MRSLNMRPMANGRLRWLPLFLMVALLSFAGLAYFYLTAKEPVKRAASVPQTPAPLKIPDGVAEARLIEILFENTLTGLNLVSDYYISVGKAGTSKSVEGDQRTLVLANPDLDHLIRTVEVHSTPVVIANQLDWVAPNSIETESTPFKDTLAAWRKAKTSGDINQLLNFYTPDFSANGKTLAQWMPTLKTEIARVQGRPIQRKDVSYLRWTDTADTMVVTFAEVLDGARTRWTKRQYWAREGNQWKIFFEGVL